MWYFIIFLVLGGGAASLFADLMSIKNGTYLQRKARQQVYKMMRKRRK